MIPTPRVMTLLVRDVQFFRLPGVTLGHLSS